MDSGDPDLHFLRQQFSDLADDHPDGELEAACLVARALDLQLDLDLLRQRIHQLCNDCDQPLAPWRYLDGLGFQGRQVDFHTADSSRLDLVLSTHSGLPIALGVLLITLSRSQGLRSWGINFPGHFLVSVDAQLVDPYQMKVVSEAGYLERLPPSQRSAAFTRATPRLVALRMLNNLKYQYANAARWDLALEMLDYQLALAPDDASLCFERGGFWLRLGAVDAARVAFEACLHAAPADSQLAKSAGVQLAAIAGQHNTRH